MMTVQLITILYVVDGHDVCLEPANVAEICRPRRGSMPLCWCGGLTREYIFGKQGQT